MEGCFMSLSPGSCDRKWVSHFFSLLISALSSLFHCLSNSSALRPLILLQKLALLQTAPFGLTRAGRADAVSIQQLDGKSMRQATLRIAWVRLSFRWDRQRKKTPLPNTPQVPKTSICKRRRLLQREHQGKVEWYHFQEHFSGCFKNRCCLLTLRSIFWSIFIQYSFQKTLEVLELGFLGPGFLFFFPVYNVFFIKKGNFCNFVITFPCEISDICHKNYNLFCQYRKFKRESWLFH